jgi:hypothetical protein
LRNDARKKLNQGIQEKTKPPPVGRQMENLIERSLAFWARRLAGEGGTDV